jgi:DNA polymerase III subunit delta
MLYLFTGNDHWSIHRMVKALAQTSGVTHVQQINHLQQAINTARMSGLIDSIRLVWLQVNQLTVDTQAAKSTIQQLQTIQEADNILVIQLGSPPDQRTTLGKWLTQNATCKAFNLIPIWQEKDLLAISQQMAQELGANLKAEQLTQIIGRVGNDPADIYGAIEKLQLYALTYPVVDDVIAALVPQTYVQSFDLPKHLIHRQTEEALTIISHTPSQEAMKVIYGVYGALNTWIAVKLCWECGIHDQSIVAKQASIANPRRLYFIEKELQGISLRWLQHVQSEVLASELAMKSTASTDPLVDLVLRICTEIKPRRTGRQD